MSASDDRSLSMKKSFYLDLGISVKMFLEHISTIDLFIIFVTFIFSRCVPQICTFGENFNAFYGRCEKIQCRLGFNVTSHGKCVGRIIYISFL